MRSYLISYNNFEVLKSSIFSVGLHYRSLSLSDGFVFTSKASKPDACDGERKNQIFLF